MPAAAAPGIPAQHAPGGVPGAGADQEVDEAFRPYLLTGGRTGGGASGIGIETLLVRDLNVPAGPHTTSPELARIADSCDDPVASPRWRPGSACRSASSRCSRVTS
jgi:hypothetical protein